MGIIDTIQIPDDLKRLPLSQLPAVATDLRRFLLETLNETGGHLAAGLGVVELTLALHYVFDPLVDRLIWDVGHQSAPHKILTARRSKLKTVRQKEGLSPFPRREESPYDAFGVGHSSTSISAALGMTLAKQARKEAGRAIAIIGDGAMTAGMAFEALNHAGDLKADLLVILNDNEMSISGNVGALSNYFARILSSKLYMTMRQESKRALDLIPSIRELAKKTEAHLKGMVVPGALFEEMGFNYLGPIDGHDTKALVKTLENIKANPGGPRLLHVITQKGKGYPPAQANPIQYHSVAKGFYQAASSFAKPSYSDIFGDWLCEMAAIEPQLVAITPAMREGSKLVRFAENFPDRYFDVGIAEQHSVTLAAGLACEKMRPVVAIYSTFLQRAYDQLIHDVAIQNLPVLFAIDRAGLVSDGPTHSGNFDLSYLRCIPNMIVMTPCNSQELRDMLYTGFKALAPVAIRYPKASCTPVLGSWQQLPIGKAQLIKKGQKIALLSFGTLLATAQIVADKLNATLVNMRFVKPLDEALIKTIANQHPWLVTLEENVIAGGAGEGVNAFLLAQGRQNSVINLGLPDHFVEQGTPDEMLKSCGLDAASIIQTIEKRMQSHFSGAPKAKAH